MVSTMKGSEMSIKGLSAGSNIVEQGFPTWFDAVVGEYTQSSYADSNES